MSARRKPLRLAIVVGAVIVCACPNTARAETPPTVWDQAKDQTTRDRYATHALAMRSVEEFSLHKDDDVPANFGLIRAKQILEAAHAAESPDPLLRIDLGEIYEKLELNTAAVALLQPALAMAPGHVAAERGWNALAYAFARMDRPASELAAYEQYLRTEVDEEQRASATLNMAEAEMRRGDLKAAITGYEEAVRLAQDVRTGGGVVTFVLSIWGLAVAKDRNADATGAMLEARRAVSHDRLLLMISPQNPGVFFVPAYERSYYLGLGELALTVDSDTTRAKVQHAERAERRFSEYVKAATSDDRWLRRAKEHLEFARKRQKELGKGLAREPDEDP